MRRLSENKIVVVQIDDRLKGQLAGSVPNGSGKPDRRYDDRIVSVSALNNFRFARENPDYFYIFVEPPYDSGQHPYRDVDGDRHLSAYWGKVYALAMCMRAMPKARCFLALDTDAFLGVTEPIHDLRHYVDLAERSDRHVVLQACRTPGLQDCTDFWGRTLGAITPPVYPEPMAFNSGAVAVRQSAEGRAFVHTWLGLTGKSVGPSPLEQRFSAIEIVATLSGMEGMEISDAAAHDCVERAVMKARAHGAPILPEQERAYLARAPGALKDIEPSKKSPSAAMGDNQLRFNLRSITDDNAMRRLADWMTQGGGTGDFGRILKDCLESNSGGSPVEITAIKQRVLQDRSGEFLIDWPGDQERLSWAYSLLSHSVFVVPWNHDPHMPCLQYCHNHRFPLPPGDCLISSCPSPIWHPSHSYVHKKAAYVWMCSYLKARCSDEEINLRRLPVLKPHWGNTRTGGRTCTLEAFLARIDEGRFELRL